VDQEIQVISPVLKTAASGTTQESIETLLSRIIESVRFEMESQTRTWSRKVGVEIRHAQKLFTRIWELQRA